MVSMQHKINVESLAAWLQLNWTDDEGNYLYLPIEDAIQFALRMLESVNL